MSSTGVSPSVGKCAAKSTSERPLRAAIYCRISSDGEGRGLGVANQERECRALAAARGFSLGERAVYVDNDLSAFSRRHRPEFDRMLADLADGTVDVIVVWHQDRLTRHPRELEDVIDALEAAGAPPIATVQSGDTDLSTSSGRMFARMLGAVARGESEHKSERQKLKASQLARDGKPSGMARTYGFDRPRLEDGRPVPGSRVQVVGPEADRIREAASRVLSGESLYAIVNDWNSAGVPTLKGTRWSTTSLRTILTAPRMAGLRRHRGIVVGTADHDSILDVSTWQRVEAILTDPARKKWRVKRKYLLTGILRCELCGSYLYATPRRHRTSDGSAGVYRSTPGETQRVYGCTKTNGGCGGINVIAEGGTGGGIEPFVEAAVLEALRGPGLAAAKARLLRTEEAVSSILAEIHEDEERLAELGRLFADRQLDRTTLVSGSEKLRSRIDEAKARLAEIPRADAFDGIEDLDEEWAAMSLERRRAVIKGVLSDIRVGPATVRNRFDPDRVALIWKA